MRFRRSVAVLTAVLAALAVSCATDGGGDAEPQPSSQSEPGY
jgi:hypothetical protein